jgi:2-methylisocitrate lyase-like PEP mutase family enzyme
MIDAAEQAGFLAAVRSAAVSAGVGLVINARMDSFLRRAGSPAEQLAASIDCGARHLTAGADCVYPIGAGDPNPIRALVEGVPGAVNVGYRLGQAVVGRARRARSRPGELRADPAAAPVRQVRGAGLVAAVAPDENPFVL